MSGGSRRGSYPQARSGQGQPGQGKPGQGKSGQGKAGGRGTEPRTAQYGPAPDADRLTRLLEPVIHALDLDLEVIKVTSAGRRRVLRVIVDGDGGVSLDDIALASREMSARLDSATVMGEQPYTLEVSSPGVDRPLTLPRHWRRNVGRLVVAPLTDAIDDAEGNEAARASGRIVGASETGVTLDTGGLTRDYTYAELGPGRIEIEFGHFDEPDDAEPGDDELVEED
jgi:ribosome maturation factor RimP